MKDYTQRLSFLILLLVSLSSLSAKKFYHECKDPLPYYTEIQMDQAMSNGSIVVETFDGLSPIDAPKQMVSGRLFYPVYNNEGCYPYDYDLENIPAEDWIALVKRGTCPFSIKEYIAEVLGAKGLIVYQNMNSPPTVMTGLADTKGFRFWKNGSGFDLTYQNFVLTPANLTAAMITMELGEKYYDLLENKTELYATMKSKAKQARPAAVSQSNSNTILLVFAGFMCPAAILLNLIALVAILCYPEKPKPYLYLITNLVITDLMVSIIGTTMIAVLYKQFGKNEEPEDEYEAVIRPCIGIILNDLWDQTVLSNLLTLFSLTIEHFIAFRWPLKHKLLVTKQRVLIVIAIQWIISAAPFVTFILEDYFNRNIPDCYADKGFCHMLFYIHHGQPKQSWVPSVTWTAILMLIFIVMVLVYGYIIWVINKVSIRNPGFRKKRGAVITTLCLILSFVLSYLFYFVQHFVVVAEKDYQTELVKDVQHLFSDICPACLLMLDFLFTGMVGAIMDPIIYCARMKEIKLSLNRLFKTSGFVRRPSVTSTTGYIKAPVQSTGTVEEVHI